MRRWRPDVGLSLVVSGTLFPLKWNVHLTSYCGRISLENSIGIWTCLSAIWASLTTVLCHHFSKCSQKGGMQYNLNCIIFFFTSLDTLDLWHNWWMQNGICLYMVLLCLSDV